MNYADFDNNRTRALLKSDISISWMVLSSTIEAGFKDVKFGEFVQKLNNRYTHVWICVEARRDEHKALKAFVILKSNFCYFKE